MVGVRLLEGRQHAAVARQSAVACRQGCVLRQTACAASVEGDHARGSAEDQQRKEGEEGRAGACTGSSNQMVIMGDMLVLDPQAQSSCAMALVRLGDCGMLHPRLQVITRLLICLSSRCVQGSGMQAARVDPTAPVANIYAPHTCHMPGFELFARRTPLCSCSGVCWCRCSGGARFGRLRIRCGCLPCCRRRGRPCRLLQLLDGNLHARGSWLVTTLIRNKAEPWGAIYHLWRG